MGKLGSALGKVVGKPLKALLPKNPWLRAALIALPILILLALLEPVLSLFEKAVDLCYRLVVPLLESSGGRLLALNLLLLFLCALAFVLLRSRLRNLRSGLVLRRHLDGIAHLLDDDLPRARAAFRKVGRSRALPPAEFPPILQDAKIKMARLAMAEGDVDGAVSWLTRVREVDLPKELRRSLTQLRAEAFIAQGCVLPETLESDLRAAVAKFGDDARLYAMLRQLVLEQGSRPAEVVALQERVYEHAAPRARDEERQRLLDDLERAAEAALDSGELDAARVFARRAKKLDPDSPLPGCLLGKVHLARGDVRAAFREWGKTRSPRGLELVSRVLDERPGAVSPREVLEACPMHGAVLLVARDYARQGEHRKAERAARSAARHLGLTPSTAAILAEVLELCGRHDDAQLVCREAARRLVARGEVVG